MYMYEPRICKKINKLPYRAYLFTLTRLARYKTASIRSGSLVLFSYMLEVSMKRLAAQTVEPALSLRENLKQTSR